MVSRMKKKFFECGIHGITLFRCKRKCWNAGEKFYSDYKEECFRCISEGRYKKAEKTEEKRKHLRL
jgi:hypothetical protein